MPSSEAFPGWCALCRRVALGALAVGVLVSAAPGQAAPAAPTPLRFAADSVGTGLDQPGRVVQDLAVQQRSLAVLQAREQARRATIPAAPSATAVPTVAAPVLPAGPAPTLGGQAPQAVSVAIGYALAQVGKPYVWGATGPDSYDCSGLVQRSYAMAGVALPRTSREQARVGTPVQLADLLPGDLLFWAYDPGDLSTVHHVAMYLGDGRIVQAPQPGEYVEVTSLWLTGYAGAVRVATGPADTTLPAVPPGVPGTGLTPAGDAMPDGSPPPDDGSLPSTTLPPGPAGPAPGTTAPGTTAPGTTAPGTTAPGTTSPGTNAPGTSAPGTTAPGTTAPGTTAPGTTAPGTTAPGTTAPGTTAPGTTAPGTTAPGTTAPGTTAPGTTAPGTTAPGTNPPTGSGATGSGATAPGTTAPGTTAPGTTAPGTTPPAPAPSTTPPPPAPETTSPAAAPSSAAAATSSAATSSAATSSAATSSAATSSAATSSAAPSSSAPASAAADAATPTATPTSTP